MDDARPQQWALLWAREDTSPDKNVDETLDLAARYLEFLVKDVQAGSSTQQSPS